MHVLNAARRQLDYLDWVRAGQDQLTDIDRQAGLRADEQALDLCRAFDHAAASRLDGEPETVHHAHVLHGPDRAQQVRPAAARELGAAQLIGVRSDDGQHESLRAKRREPSRVTVDVRELRLAQVVMVQHRVDRPGHHAQAVPSQQSARCFAAIGQEAGRACLDSVGADRSHLGQDAVGLELRAPRRAFADAP